MQAQPRQGGEGGPQHAPPVTAAPPRLSAPLPPGHGLSPLQMQVLRAQIVAFRSIKSAFRRLEDDRRAGKPVRMPAPEEMCSHEMRVAARAAPYVPKPHAPLVPQQRVTITAPPRPPLLRPQDWAPDVLAAIGKALKLAGAQAWGKMTAQASMRKQGATSTPTPLPGLAAVPPVLSPPRPTPSPALTPAPAPAHTALPQPAAMAAPAGPAAPAAPPQEPSLLRRNGGPLFTLGPAPAQNPLGPPLPLMCDVGELLAREWHMRMSKCHVLAQNDLDRKLASARSAKRAPPFAVRLRRARLMARHAQAQLRSRIESVQADIHGLPDRTYRKFVRNCARERFDQAKQEDKAKNDALNERAKQMKASRAALGDRSNAARELRVARNRGVVRAHERLARLRSKARGDERAQRLEALKAHDFEAYQELLQRETGGTAPGERYEAISKFLSETEEYLHKLTARVASVKLAQEASEAAAAAISAARLQGCTEEEVQAAARAAAADAAQQSDLVRSSSSAVGGDAQERYYSLAHAVEERVNEQPRLLVPPSGAQLREYQMVGLQWMVSLFNNRLNGILADEMGLGKTVQVMALLAYLMQHKGVSGPHLIIVPNAVIVNWKSELMQWLPAMRCVWYVGGREERARKFATEVASIQFNILVTTYEFIMRDRARLSKVDWHYIIIDEAQRMKDRQSKLARDLDRFVAQRRLLLTGTPLQNDLSELWSLLNLLLPEVFDDRDMFGQWFGGTGGQGAGGAAGSEDWLETEKRVVVIHRLHQILEPFMLRRQVEDVESKLPPKVAATVKVAMPPYQAVIYNWVVQTGTLRNDPEAPITGSTRRPYATLNNKCMELRKVCNHPALCYPFAHHLLDGQHLVAQCGKLLVLDRMLVKLHAAGHRVLLFSTMTKLLDLLEAYLAWRRVPDPQRPGQTAPLGYLRIDGGTALEAREAAIKRFNAPNSAAFLFLLSIRAAGRGLNLQTADTVVIYDPDANPKNEEQAIARSHRIGQSREVRVFHLEAVADAPDAPPQTAGEADQAVQRYADSVESLVRNNIQKAKIDMANEVIDAGRFDMQTTMGERKMALESLLQDEERTKIAMNQVPSLEQMNEMLARTPAEQQLFAQLDRELEWPSPAHTVPAWLRYTSAEATEALLASAKLKPTEAAQLRAAEAQKQAAGAAAAVKAEPPGVAGPSKARRKSRPTVSFQMSTASTFGTTESEVDDATHGNTDDMEEEVVGTNIREESEAPTSLSPPQPQRSSAQPPPHHPPQSKRHKPAKQPPPGQPHAAPAQPSTHPSALHASQQPATSPALPAQQPAKKRRLDTPHHHAPSAHAAAPPPAALPPQEPRPQQQPVPAHHAGPVPPRAQPSPSRQPSAQPQPREGHSNAGAGVPRGSGSLLGPAGSPRGSEAPHVPGQAGTAPSTATQANGQPRMQGQPALHGPGRPQAGVPAGQSPPHSSHALGLEGRQDSSGTHGSQPDRPAEARKGKLIVKLKNWSMKPKA